MPTVLFDDQSIMASTPQYVMKAAVKIVAKPWQSAAVPDDRLPLPPSAIMPISSSSSFPSHILHPSISDISIHVISPAASSPPYRGSSFYCSLNVIAPAAFTSSSSIIDVEKFAIGSISSNGQKLCSKCGSGDAAASDHLLPIAMQEEYPPHWPSDHEDSSTSRKTQPPMSSNIIISDQCHEENITSALSFFHRFALRRGLPSVRSSPVQRGGHLCKTSTSDRAHEYYYYYAAAMAMVAASISKWGSIFEHNYDNNNNNNNNNDNVKRIAPETMLVEGSSPPVIDEEESGKQRGVDVIGGHEVSRKPAASAFPAAGGGGDEEGNWKKMPCRSRRRSSSSDNEFEEEKKPAELLWPFLLRFPISCFGICLGLGSQAILWKTMGKAAAAYASSSTTSNSNSMMLLQKMMMMIVPGGGGAMILSIMNVGLWSLSLIALILVSVTYSLKCIFYADAVRREFCHPVRVNFFFAPSIACMFLTLSVPPSLASSIHPSIPFLFLGPLLLLELKIYGQWISGGHKRLSRVANPSTHLSLVGNFVGSHLAASAGLLELATFFWAVGVAHYIVLFVTLYQRLPSAASLPKDLHPVFFLFIAAPNSASIAWSHIVGDFDLMARIAYFVGLFLYASLAVRVNLFRGFRFSVAWWAYTFPMTASAIATIHYYLKVTHPITQVMALVLSLISTLTVVSLCVVTILHAFFWRTLFPNDVAIATSMNSGLERQSETEDPEKRKGGDEASACNFSMI